MPGKARVSQNLSSVGLFLRLSLAFMRTSAGYRAGEAMSAKTSEACERCFALLLPKSESGGMDDNHHFKAHFKKRLHQYPSFLAAVD